MATTIKQGLLVWSCGSHFPYKPQKLVKQPNLFTCLKAMQVIIQNTHVKNQLHHVTAPLLAIDLKRDDSFALAAVDAKALCDVASTNVFFHCSVSFLSLLIEAPQEMLNIRKSSLAMILTNALILSTPLEALAGTCETENSIFNMPLLLFVALVGATVGGLLARKRRGEKEQLNEQLRQINTALRRQSKIESYAPALSYAPVGGRIIESEVIVDPQKNELISRLRSGKNFLRNQEPANAFNKFKTAFELARELKDPIEEKKAARGLGASLQRQGKYREAINYHSIVLQISEREGEYSGNTEAYGAIADCYTELGDLERAVTYYDRYIARLKSD